MVIQDVPMGHGPHLWYSSLMFSYVGTFCDFFRIKECRRPRAPNVMNDRNEYTFEPYKQYERQPFFDWQFTFNTIQHGA